MTNTYDAGDTVVTRDGHTVMLFDLRQRGEDDYPLEYFHPVQGWVVVGRNGEFIFTDGHLAGPGWDVVRHATTEEIQMRDERRIN